MKQGRISTRQVAILLLTAQLSVTVFSQPSAVYRVFGYAGWQAPLMALLLAAWGTWTALSMTDRFPGESIVGVSRQVAGRWAGSL